MSKIAIVIGREYLTRVKKKSFLILTILMPFLVVLMVAAPIALGTLKDDKQRPVVVLDQTGKYANLFLNVEQTDSTGLEGYLFSAADKPLTEYQKSAGDEEAIIYISGDLIENPNAVMIYGRGEIQNDLKRYVEKVLTTQIHNDKLERYNIPELDNIIADMQSSISVQTVKWGEDGQETFSSSEIAMVLGLFSALLIYMFVLSYGAMVMQGVMEEKTSRIVEVIVGTVKPFDLMMGKIIGIMLVGFTQMAVWALMLISLSSFAGISLLPEMSMSMSNMTAEEMAALQATPMGELSSALSSLPLLEIGILFVVYFLGGYILYSSFYAAIGAAINSQEDSSQFMMPMMIVMIFSIYAAMGSMENTDGPLAFWASLFPLSSPIVMMVRIPFGVPMWQVILSVVLLYITAIAVVWLSSRIYRVGILLYGKKPTVKDLAKWLTYK